MKTLYFIIYLISFWILWKFMKIVIKSFQSSKNENPAVSSSREQKSKYKNIEDAKFTEIKDEDKRKDKD